MKKLKIAIFMVFSLFPAIYAQQEKQTKITAGVELDAFPYINKGYYGSAWLGINNLRLRGVIAKTTVPSFVVEDGFSDLTTTAYAFIADYFFKENYEGWWIGTGAEYWKNNIKNSDSNAKAGFDNIQFTLGGGYVWKIWGNLYLNPWGAIHLRAAGDSETNVGGKNYKSAFFLPEASVKIGWHF